MSRRAKTPKALLPLFGAFGNILTEGEKNTRRGVELCFKNSSFLLKTEHTDQKLSETASEVIIRI